MFELSESATLHKGRRHHKHEMAKDQSLPALVAGSGRVSISGHVEFLAVDGTIVSYKMWPEIVARFARVATLSPAAIKVAAIAAMKAATGKATASPAELAAYHVNALLDIAGGLEGHIASAVGATPSPSNVVSITGIAAE
jgi:hypothetical protein